MNSAVIRLVTAFAVAIGLLFSAVNVAVSHNPALLAAAETGRHAQLTPQNTEHDHSHEDGEPAEQTASHSHGHNPSDHSHETPAMLAGPALSLPAGLTAWLSPKPDVVVAKASFPPDRPPRSVVRA